MPFRVILLNISYLAVLGGMVFLLASNTRQTEPSCQISYMLYSRKVPSNFEHIMVHMSTKNQREWSLVLSKFRLNRYDTLISQTIKIDDDQNWYFKNNGKWEPYFGMADTITYQRLIKNEYEWAAKPYRIDTIDIQWYKKDYPETSMGMWYSSNKSQRIHFKQGVGITGYYCCAPSSKYLKETFYFCPGPIEDSTCTNPPKFLPNLIEYQKSK